MDLSEKVLYHQSHPATLAADIFHHLHLCDVASQVWSAMFSVWLSAILGSALVLRFADMERLKLSPFGHSIRQFMTRRIEAWRFGG
jgi:hypothetical protein